MMSNNFGASLILCAAAGAFSGCGLISTEIEAEIAVNFDINTEGNEYSDDFVVNPDDNQDVAANRSRIEAGQVKSILAEIVSLGDGNAATIGDAEVYVRRFSDETWGEEPAESAIARAQGVPIIAGQQLQLDLTAEDRQRVADLLFAEEGERRIEVRFSGNADGAPVRFIGRMTFGLSITAGL